MCFPLWLGLLATAISLIGDSSPARLGSLGRSNVPSGHVDRCAKERLLHRRLLFLLLWFHLVQSNIPNSRNVPVPNSGGLGSFSRAGAGVFQGVVSPPLKASQHHRRPPQLTSPSCPPLHPQSLHTCPRWQSRASRICLICLQLVNTQPTELAELNARCLGTPSS